MDDSWRPPPLPPASGNICPICSFSHFPFCPPPPFIQNPRFQNDYYYHHHHHPNIDGRPPTWYANNPIPIHRNHPSGVDRGYDGFDFVGSKRMKIEPIDSNRVPKGPLMGGEIRFPSDNERILKLIHDHGNAANGDIGLKRRHGGHPAADAMQPNHTYNWFESNGHYASGTNLGALEAHHGYRGQPPLPASPPPPLPSDIPRNHYFKPPPPPPPQKPSLFPVSVTSLAHSSSGSLVLENQSSAPNASHYASPLSSAEEFHIRQSSSEKDVIDIQTFPLKRLSSENQNVIDASHIFKQPHRATRPDHFVIILRGLPGSSGKSYMAKFLRDIEVENGGEAPRIHSMDEYFMIEVEKEDDSEVSKSSGSVRGKRQVMKTVMEYCYEPEMEEAYRASMLKAFKKTLDEGVYSFIIVDDRNLRVADFAQFWATAKRSGYDVYLVEAPYKDPVGCAARNVHNFTLPDIQKMARQWEEAPPLYLKMDIKSLLHGDGFDESGIQEVDMDMEDDDATNASQGSHVKKPHDETKDQVDDFKPLDELKVKNHQTEEVKDLSRSKWSNDLDAEEGGGMKNNSDGALSGLVQTYSSKEAKSVCWGDQGGSVGFSISATRKTNTRSLIIGPGPGYNLKSNPLSEEYLKTAESYVGPKTQSVFQDRIRAERESFKAVFDKRRQRIGGFNMDEE
ncbi:hypothetical protein E3N88_10624 [Mikania micrantha]|uniref:YLP motif-containing protein 1 n=1 Tax=Mikania micrantha TaxID=192012 RepID=A0A5N6PBD4_9ASTR|nr:hypothetical protein E3N88_10624 [Mikania micrantha]